MSEQNPERTCLAASARSNPAGRVARFPLLSRYLSITITTLALSHPQVRAQQMTSQAPPPATASAVPAMASGGQADGPEDPADTPRFPIAHRVAEASDANNVTFSSSGPQSFRQGVYLLVGDVVITYGGRTVKADRIEYDSNTGDLTATGHLVVEDDRNQEHLTASHGTYNLKSATGCFFDVSGSVGMRPRSKRSRVIYTNANPFLFAGRMVVKTGASSYDVYDGSVTSCLLPKPDWLITSAHLSIAKDRATARNSTFRLLNLPIVFLPYVTHSLDSHGRQSGFMVPTIGESSVRGLVLGEQIYMTLGRSADLTVGAEYYSLRGFAQNATFRYRGAGLNFVEAHYSGLLDRRTGTQNQGGEDIVAAGRHDFSPAARAAGNIEYLSSYIYREAFTNNFNQAITSDVLSTIYAVHQSNGIELGALADRYQGIKLIAQGTTPQQQVHLFHAPSLSVDTTEHRLPTGLVISLESSAAGLKRTQPNFATGGIVERLDLHPKISYDTDFLGWRVRPAFAVRETFYNRSRKPNAPENRPVEAREALSRADVEFSFEARPPVLSRTFSPSRFTRLFGTQVRHTIAPEITYRLTRGVSNFDRVLRFDAVDVASDTNEVEYGVTQRLYRKTAHHGPCEDMTDEPGLNPAPSDARDSGPETVDLAASDQPPAQHPCSSDEVLSWRLTQKYFFDPTFGGAVVDSQRNIFTSTLDLSGVAFLTEPRKISPLISRLRLRSSAHTDLEWDFDLDTGSGRFNSSNVYLDLHQRNTFAALSYARLDAPGRFSTQNLQNTSQGVSSAVSNFEQLRLLLGYGNPAKKGLSIAGNTGLDLKSFTGTDTSSPGTAEPRSIFPALLQYLAVQTSYNWNCCGVAFEYREFELGSVRNVPGYRFSFSLANVGTAGNLRRAERLF